MDHPSNPPKPRGGDDADDTTADDDNDDRQEPPTKKKKKAGERNDGGNDDDDEEEEEDDNKSNDENKNKEEDGKYARLNVYGEHKRAVSSVKFAPSKICKKDYYNNSKKNYSSLVASASASAFVKVWDLKNEYFDDVATALATENNSDAGTSSPANNNNNKSNKTERKALQHCSLCIGHSRGINEIAWNPVSPLLASASDDKTVRLWDAVTGDSLVEFKGHDNFVFCIDQHHALIASGSFDETVKLWDIRSGDCVSTLPAHSDPVTAVSFNRDGTCVSSASHDGLIRIWDVATGECLKTIFATGNPPVSSVKYSPNGKYLLAGTLDSCLRLWPVNQSRRTCSKTYSKSHVNTKYSVASCFDCFGNVVTGSENSTVVIYDVQTRKPVQILRNGHTDAVLSVSAHDTLPILASGGITNDRKVEFWVNK